MISRLVYIYSAHDLEESQIQQLYAIGDQHGFHVQFRGPAYADARSKTTPPLAFISHDSRDKQHIALPLANKISELGAVNIWFDEFSLFPGDSLRESIERGIQSSRFCILILSQHFLENTGWAKVEFNAAFTKQLFESSAVLLPIWVDVDRKAVYEYSPTLANISGVPWSLGVEKVASRLLHAAQRSR